MSSMELPRRRRRLHPQPTRWLPDVGGTRVLFRLHRRWRFYRRHCEPRWIRCREARSERAQARQPALDPQLLIMTAGGFAFGWALVPLYDVFCKVAGIGNAEAKAGAAEVQREPSIRTAKSRSSSSPTPRRWAASSSGPRRPPCACTRASSTTAQFFAKNLTGRDIGRAGGAEHLRRASPRSTSTRPNAFASVRSTSASARGATCRCASSSIRTLPANIDKITLAYTFYDRTQAAAPLDRLE